MIRPVVWSIAGNDSGGGAGLAADQRAADACDVHLCPVVAAITAQNSREVTMVAPVSVPVLDAQLGALAHDMPPQAVKTGLLGGAAQVLAVARWIDRLRERAPVALVVDTVLGSTTGATFADDETCNAYRQWLLPRATVVTPNRREAARLLDFGAAAEPAAIPSLARALRAMGARAACVTGGDDLCAEGLALDWIDTEHAAGWLALPRVATGHNHGTGCTFATSLAAALARGFVAADAAILAKMASTCALRNGYAAGSGAGPVHAGSGFATDPALLPMLSWGESATFVRCAPAATAEPIGLYPIAGDAAQLTSLLAAGVRTVQLRIKPASHAEAGFNARLRAEIIQAVRACRHVGATLYVNDHWQLAHDLGASGVHLGQEDLLALSEDERAALLARGLLLGVSSHSLWELCRARSLAPAYVACGPVWPTATKEMPWQSQGLDNLAWWQRMAGVPVVAIGGLIDEERIRLAAATGVDGVCIVRGANPHTVNQLVRALREGRGAARTPVPEFPHPTLPNDFVARS